MKNLTERETTAKMNKHQPTEQTLIELVHTAEWYRNQGIALKSSFREYFFKDLTDIIK